MKKGLLVVSLLLLVAVNGWADNENMSTEKTFYIGMTHGADDNPTDHPNQKIDFQFPEGAIFWGSLIIEVAGNHHYQNSTGKYTKEYGLGLNPNGAMHANNTQVTSDLGLLTENVFLTPARWDPVNNRYYITFVHRTKTSNFWAVKIKAFSTMTSCIQTIDNITMGPVYTTDATEYPMDNWNVNDNALVVNKSGNVGIGTTTPGDYKLNVAGKMRADEIQVTTASVDNLKIKTEKWADYVLKDDYKLPSLDSVETFIKENNHLPDVPSEKEVKENGIDMSEMMATQMKKIEELTLHLIEQNKMVTTLVEENNVIKSDNEEMKKRLVFLEKK